MKRPLALGLALLALVGAADVLAGTSVLGHFRSARIEPGRFRSGQLDASTRERLARLTDSVFLTLYVSPRTAMPSSMRHLEEQATDVLAALRDGGGGRVEFQIVDPTGDPDLQRFAGRRKVTPVRVRSVERDGWSEVTVWSSLTIDYGNHAPVVINGLRPEHLPRLQALLCAHLDQMEAPRRPRLALSAPAGTCTTLASELAERGEVARLDLDAGDAFPADADVLFWIDPGRADAQVARALELFVAGGRSVVLAGSGLDAAEVRLVDTAAGPAGEASFRARSDGLPGLLSGFGLQRREGLLLDPMSQSLQAGEVSLPAPWILRCIAPNQDFRSFRGQPNGHLMFEAPQAFVPDLARLAEVGATAEVLGTASDGAWTVPRPDQPVRVDTLVPDAPGATATPRAPLLVAVRPDDPRRGLVVAAASSSPFRDGFLDMQGAAHRLLVRTLVDTLGSDGRLVAARVGVSGPAPLPELAAGARAAWRFAVLGGLPLLLLLVGALRGAFGGGERASRSPGAARWRFSGGLWLRFAAGAVLVAVATAWLRAGPRADLTEDGLNELHPRTRELAAAARGPAALQAELFVSAPDRLPPALRGGVARLADLLSGLRRAGASLGATRVTWPDELPRAEREALVARGIAPVPYTSRDEETTQVRQVWCTLRLARADGGGSTLLRFPDESSFEALEFRLAFALWRLQDGHDVRIGFASDAARLSAAEAHELYQQQGLFAPQAGDSYGLARELLRAADFDVVEVNPRGTTLPPGLDALVWMQPRRAIDPMMEQVALYLHGGGRALVAAQQFVVQSRQFPGTDYRIVYWPQPQLPDLDRVWLPDLGIELVRELLFDELKTSVPIETMVYQGSKRQLVDSEVALPFVLRVAASSYAPDSAVTRRVGDLVFPFPAFLRTDAGKLAAAGLSAEPLMTSSDRSWSFDWGGGWIPPEILAGPQDAGAGSARWIGPQVLALDVRGTFPLPARPLVEQLPAYAPDGTLLPDQPVREWPPRDAPAAAPGRLVLVAASEPFRNARLVDREFPAGHLLLNAVASLALDEGLADVASKRPVARGFGLVDQGRRLRWRGIVLGALPLALLAFGAGWATVRRGRVPSGPGGAGR